jgi:hypothetical protein
MLTVVPGDDSGHEAVKDGSRSLIDDADHLADDVGKSIWPGISSIF